MTRLTAGRRLDAIVHTHLFSDLGPVVSNTWPCWLDVETGEYIPSTRLTGVEDDVEEIRDWVYKPQHGSWPPTVPVYPEALIERLARYGATPDYSPIANVRRVPGYSTDEDDSDDVLTELLHRGWMISANETWRPAKPGESFSHECAVLAAQERNIFVAALNRKEALCLLALMIQGLSVEEEDYVNVFEFESAAPAV